MAVMRNLVIDGTTYETVGEASVTQVVSSGTKIATVTIDGTGTDIYAPSAPAPTAMTEQEVSDAVDAGWLGTQYDITITNEFGLAYDPSDTSFTTPITKAPEGATVYVHHTSKLTRIDSNPSVTFTMIDSYYTFSFTMPGSAISITPIPR